MAATLGAGGQDGRVDLCIVRTGGFGLEVPGARPVTRRPVAVRCP